MKSNAENEAGKLVPNPSLFYKKDLYQVKASSLQLGFNGIRTFLSGQPPPKRVPPMKLPLVKLTPDSPRGKLPLNNAPLDNNSPDNWLLWDPPRTTTPRTSAPRTITPELFPPGELSPRNFTSAIAYWTFASKTFFPE